QIEITPVLPQPISDACDRVRIDGSPVQDAVCMVAADPEKADLEIVRLVDLPLLEERITKILLDLDPVLDPQGPDRFACTRSLWRFLEWLHYPELDGERIRELLESWRPARSEGDLMPVSRWQDDGRELATRLAGALEAVQLVEQAVTIYDRRVGHEMNTFWRRALAWFRTKIPAEDFRLLE